MMQSQVVESSEVLCKLDFEAGGQGIKILDLRVKTKTYPIDKESSIVTYKYEFGVTCVQIQILALQFGKVTYTV